MLINRLISSAILLTILLATIFLFPKFIIAIVIAILIGIGTLEFYKLSEMKGYVPFKIFGVVSGMALTVVTYILVSNNYSSDVDNVISILLFVILISILVKCAFKKEGVSVIVNSAITLLGILYVSFLFTFIIKLRYMPNPEEGKIWVTALFTITKISDVFAYFCGMKWGRHKLIPRISPNKSIEGAIAGIVGSILMSLLLKICFLRHMDWEAMILLGILMSVVGQAGDLIESLMKRDAQIKDTSKLVPGMGGVLDFMDSLLFTGPVMYIFLLIVL